MPNISIILNGDYDAAIPWSQRKDGGKRSELISKIRRILSLLSGNETLLMLRDLIKKEERKIIAKEYFEALKNISAQINKGKSFRPFKMARLSRQKLWSSCRKKK